MEVGRDIDSDKDMETDRDIDRQGGTGRDWKEPNKRSDKRLQFRQKKTKCTIPNHLKQNNAIGSSTRQGDSFAKSEKMPHHDSVPQEQIAFGNRFADSKFQFRPIIHLTKTQQTWVNSDATHRGQNDRSFFFLLVFHVLRWEFFPVGREVFGFENYFCTSYEKDYQTSKNQSFVSTQETSFAFDRTNSSKQKIARIFSTQNQLHFSWTQIVIIVLVNTISFTTSMWRAPEEYGMRINGNSVQISVLSLPSALCAFCTKHLTILLWLVETNDFQKTIVYKVFIFLAFFLTVPGPVFLNSFTQQLLQASRGRLSFCFSS